MDKIILSQVQAANAGLAGAVRQNGDFVVTLTEAVQLPPGGSLAFSKAFIDSQQMESNNIVVEESETSPSWTFCYYDRLYETTDKVLPDRSRVLDDADLDYGYYSAYSEVYTDIVNYAMFEGTKLNWGGFFAVFSYLDINNNPAQKRVFVPPFFADPVPTSSYEAPLGITIIAGTLQLISPDPGDLASLYKTAYVPSKNGVTPGTIANLKLQKGTFFWNIPQGSYSGESIAKMLTDQASLLPREVGQEQWGVGNPFTCRTDDDSIDAVRFVRISDQVVDVDLGYEYYDRVHNVRLPYWYGTAQVDIRYDDNGSGIFEIFQIDNRIYNPADAKTPTPNILWVKDPTSETFYSVEQSCGIFLIDMQPRSFWQEKLGFDPGKILVDVKVADATGYEYVDLRDLNPGTSDGRPKITGGPVTMQTLFPNYDRRIADEPDFPLYVDVTDESVPMTADQVRSSGVIGYYEIQITGLAATSPGVRYDATGADNTIYATCSLQNNANDVITVYSGDGVTLTNTSDQPMFFNQFHVRILNPITKQVPGTLGENNTIELVVQGNIP